MSEDEDNGSVCALDAAVVLWLSGGMTKSGMFRLAQACSNFPLNSDPPSTWMDLILNGVVLIMWRRKFFAVSFLASE